MSIRQRFTRRGVLIAVVVGLLFAAFWGTYIATVAPPAILDHPWWAFLVLPFLLGEFTSGCGYCVVVFLRPFRSVLDALSGGVALLFLLSMFLVVCWAVCNSLDSAGLIAHREDTTINANASWFVGEWKECQSYPIAAAVGKDIGYALGSIVCDNGPAHNMKVTFWGRETQREYGVVKWRCTRTQDGFTCYELSGVRQGL